jgi:ferredoxin
MSYVVTEDCIRCKFQDCVEVCPVDAFYEGENMLVISPDHCIDCSACESECPAEAILPEQMAPEWLELNQIYSAKWPLIKEKGAVPEDADDFVGVENKLKGYFSEEPAP